MNSQAFTKESDREIALETLRSENKVALENLVHQHVMEEVKAKKEAGIKTSSRR